MGKGLKIDPRYEKYVQTEKGLRIEGCQEFYKYENGKRIFDKVYTWMRYVDTKTMDDLKR